jgi:hypothetical protein
MRFPLLGSEPTLLPFPPFLPATVIVRLYEIFMPFCGSHQAHARNLDRMERDSPYIDAPVWPWSAAGWLIVVMVMAMFVAAWSRSS